MKKIISFLFIVIFLFTLTACGEQKVTEVTDENVAELFKPSLEAYVCYNGSGVLEFEKGEDGNAVEYDYEDGAGIAFKVTENLTVQEVEDRLHSYVYDPELGFFESFYFEKDGDLYLGLAAYGTGLTNYDLNSIELYGTEDGKYYITVDTYGDYPVTDENHEMGDIVYIQSEVFITTLNDGILYIEGLDEPIEKEDYNAENERFYMNDVAKFYTNNLNVVYNLTEK